MERQQELHQIVANAVISKAKEHGAIAWPLAATAVVTLCEERLCGSGSAVRSAPRKFVHRSVIQKRPREQPAWYGKWRTNTRSAGSATPDRAGVVCARAATIRARCGIRA